MIRSNGIRVFARTATFISILSLLSCEKHKTTTLLWENNIQNRAIASLEAGNCNDFWQLVFPYAKANQPTTASLIASAIYMHGLVPPGTNNDILFRLRGVMSGYAESARSGEPVAIDMLIAIFQSDILQESGGDNIAQCLATGIDVNGCIEKAIETDLLPSFTQWVDEVERLGKNKGNARCTRANKSHRLHDDDFDIRG